MTPVGTLATSASQQSAATTATSDDAKQATLDYNAFLTLLLAQMQNQDPLQPMDSTEYMSQLATFSNVEQGLKMNEKLDKILLLSNIEQASGIVGHTLTSADGTITGIVKSVRIEAGGATAILADDTEVRIDDGVTISA